MNFNLSDNAKDYLLKKAKNTVYEHLGVKVPYELNEEPDELKMKCGMFVTLHKRGNLRGCIGFIIGAMALRNMVEEAALAAAFQDTRFAPVSADELEEIDFEITVLSPLVESSVDDIVVGRDGVYLEYDYHHAVFLPQVAAEQGWGKAQLLNNLCIKAGLPPSTWQKEAVKLSRFEGIIFKDKM